LARVGVITFLGSLDDRDALRAVSTVGGTPVPLWHGDTDLQGVDAILLPGGFSYGDHLRCGALARFAPIMGAVAEFAAAGGPVLGICNGFQILCEADLLPGILTPNHGQRFICRDVDLIVEAASPWIGNRPVGDTITVPVKHGDGAWFHPQEGLAELEANGQILLRYSEDINAAIAPPLPLLSPPSPDISAANISAANISADICLCVLPFTVHCRPLLLAAALAQQRH
jgi:phosphoribosylformylglycinamidine synthase